MTMGNADRAAARHRWAVVAAGLLLLAACNKPVPLVYPGYAEADYVRLAAPISGTLAALHVSRGDVVAAAAPAFALEQQSEFEGRKEAEFRVRRSQDQLNDLKLGRRPEELQALRAQLAQAQSGLDLSQSELARASKLVAEKFNSPASLDQARAAVSRDQARVSELNAQLRLAVQGGRSNEIAAAGEEVRAAQAQLAQAQWRLEQKTQHTPVAGDVVDVFYREGEFVPAGAPVISLLPPGNIKARFFVSQAVLGALAIGQSVSLQCDGCGAPIAARISFMAREAEYTAPIIYSKENRATLVFMVEARPAAADARRLHPGQPLEVRLDVAPAAAQ